jgi:hypothetical protein
LEALGHAIDYLVDSYCMCESGDRFTGEFEAVLILKKANRAVFAECRQVESLPVRLLRRFRFLWARTDVVSRPPSGKLFVMDSGHSSRNRPCEKKI